MKIGDEWRHFRNISKLFVFILLARRPHCFANFSLFVFCRGQLLTATETTVTWIRRISWFLTWRHDPFRNPDPFLHWLTVNFIGCDWSGNFKARSKGPGKRGHIVADTLLPMMFLGLRKLGNTNVSEQNQTFFVSRAQNLCLQQMKCCALVQTGKHLCRQQCVLVCLGL